MSRTFFDFFEFVFWNYAGKDRIGRFVFGIAFYLPSCFTKKSAISLLASIDSGSFCLLYTSS